MGEGSAVLAASALRVREYVRADEQMRAHKLVRAGRLTAAPPPEGPGGIQLSLRLSVPQPITKRLHYSHSDLNKTTKQKIRPPADTVILTSSGITAREPQQNPVLVFFHNPHAKESASTNLDHPCTSR